MPICSNTKFSFGRPSDRALQLRTYFFVLSSEKDGESPCITLWSANGLLFHFLLDCDFVPMDYRRDMSGESAGSNDGNVTAMLMTVSFVFVVQTGLSFISKFPTRWVPVPDHRQIAKISHLIDENTHFCYFFSFSAPLFIFRTYFTFISRNSAYMQVNLTSCREVQKFAFHKSHQQNIPGGASHPNLPRDLAFTSVSKNRSYEESSIYFLLSPAGHFAEWSWF